MDFHIWNNVAVIKNWLCEFWKCAFHFGYDCYDSTVWQLCIYADADVCCLATRWFCIYSCSVVYQMHFIHKQLFSWSRCQTRHLDVSCFWALTVLVSLASGTRHYKLLLQKLQECYWNKQLFCNFATCLPLQHTHVGLVLNQNWSNVCVVVLLGRVYGPLDWYWYRDLRAIHWLWSQKRQTMKNWTFGPVKPCKYQGCEVSLKIIHPIMFTRLCYCLFQ